MIRGLRARAQARRWQRADQLASTCRLLDEALAEARPGHAVTSAVPVDGWACARGRLSAGSVLEGQLSGGGMVDVLVDGVVVGTDFPWDRRLGDTPLLAALTETLDEILPPIAEMAGD